MYRDFKRFSIWQYSGRPAPGSPEMHSQAVSLSGLGAMTPTKQISRDMIPPGSENHNFRPESTKWLKDLAFRSDAQCRSEVGHAENRVKPSDEEHKAAHTMPHIPPCHESGMRPLSSSSSAGWGARRRSRSVSVPHIMADLIMR